MSWMAVSVEVDAACAERLDSAFFEAGALAVDISDAAAGTPQEQAYYAEADAPAAPWAFSRVTALFPRDIDLDADVAAALCSASVPASTPYQAQHVGDQDWVRASQSEHLPIRVSQRLWVVPSWRAPPDPYAVNIVLDPGVAFGTGTHPSTRLCLRWIEAHIRGGETLIDFGCGSGILAIAALKLGAGGALGVDIDEQALLAAQRNAMQNRVEARFVAGPTAGDEPARLVVANILANPLIVLAPLLAKLTVNEGRIALSGILLAQADDVRAAYAEWFLMDEFDHEEGWALVGGIRKDG